MADNSGRRDTPSDDARHRARRLGRALIAFVAAPTLRAAMDVIEVYREDLMTKEAIALLRQVATDLRVEGAREEAELWEARARLLATAPHDASTDRRAARSAPFDAQRSRCRTARRRSRRENDPRG